MWLDGYQKQFGNRLENFPSIAVPTALAELTPCQREKVTKGEEEFPFGIKSRYRRQMGVATG